MDGIDSQFKRLEQEARQMLQRPMDWAECELETVFGSKPGQSVASQIRIPYKRERQILGALAALPQNEAKTFDLDGLLIGLAAQHAVDSLRQGDTQPLLLNVSFDIFTARANTERFFALCAKMDSRVTGRLVLLLTSLPEGLPRTRLLDCVNRLRPFCRAVGYAVDDVADIERIDLSNSFNPIVVVPVAACRSSTSAALKAVFSALQSQRAKVLIRDVASEKDAAALRSLGADMILMKRPED
jgi:hypothetical protein